MVTMIKPENEGIGCRHVMVGTQVYYIVYIHG